MELVWRQLDLFSDARPSRSIPVMIDAREKRTELHWQKSIYSYLEWRAGVSWRRLSDPAHRHDPDRLWYANGLALMSSILAGSFPAQKSRPYVVPAQSAESLADRTDALRRSKLSALTRPELVKKLLAVDPTKTDAGILAHFTRAKLARLIVDAENRASIEWKATA